MTAEALATESEVFPALRFPPEFLYVPVGPFRRILPVSRSHAAAFSGRFQSLFLPTSSAARFALSGYKNK